MDLDETLKPQDTSGDVNLLDGRTLSPSEPGSVNITDNRLSSKSSSAVSSAEKVIAGRYKVLGELGRGGMGVVYRCWDKTARIEVALKTLPQEIAHDKHEMESVRCNFQIVSELIHSHIAAYRTLEEDNGCFFLVMELVKGKELDIFLDEERAKNALTEKRILNIARQIAEALDFAHKKNIIHRDIKPGNIMIGNNDAVKVLDFGLAAEIMLSKTRVTGGKSDTGSGTPAYMAPEQWQGRTGNAASDQYALAEMIYEMFAGERLFNAPTVSYLCEIVLKAEPQKPESMPDNVWQAVKKSLSKDPKDRFACCMDLINAASSKKNVSPAPEPPKAVSNVNVDYYTLLVYLNGFFKRESAIPDVMRDKFSELKTNFEKLKKGSVSQNVVNDLNELKSQCSALQNYCELQTQIENIKRKLKNAEAVFSKDFSDKEEMVVVALDKKDFTSAVYFSSSIISEIIPKMLMPQIEGLKEQYSNVKSEVYPFDNGYVKIAENAEKVVKEDPVEGFIQWRNALAMAEVAKNLNNTRKQKYKEISHAVSSQKQSLSQETVIPQKFDDLREKADAAVEKGDFAGAVEFLEKAKKILDEAEKNNTVCREKIDKPVANGTVTPEKSHYGAFIFWWCIVLGISSWLLKYFVDSFRLDLECIFYFLVLLGGTYINGVVALLCKLRKTSFFWWVLSYYLMCFLLQIPIPMYYYLMCFLLQIPMYTWADLPKMELVVLGAFSFFLDQVVFGAFFILGGYAMMGKMRK